MGLEVLPPDVNESESDFTPVGDDIRFGLSAVRNVGEGVAELRLGGDFVRAAQEHRRDFTVDWVHLKLNDQAQRTVLCKDPFRAHDERVHKLIEGM